MNTWAPIWSGIVDSSLWEESGDVVKVFMTMLATKDADHVCRLDAYRIGKKCVFGELEVLEILKILASPDKRRAVPQEFEGRRIKAVEDGWLILNGAKYRDMVAEERKKARNRRAQEAWRRRQEEAKNGTTPMIPQPGPVDTQQTSSAPTDGVGNGSCVQELMLLLTKEYQRPETQRWTHAEEYGVAEIARRPDAMGECRAIFKHRSSLREKERKFFPKSIGSLLEKWNDVLDASRQPKPDDNCL